MIMRPKNHLERAYVLDTVFNEFISQRTENKLNIVDIYLTSYVSSAVISR